MSKTLPAAFTPVDGIEFRTRRPIRSTDWAALAAQQNLMYSQRGERIGGQCFQPFLWENNTATFSGASTNTSTLKDISEFKAPLYAKKSLGALVTAQVQFEVNVYGSDFQFKVEIIDGDDGITVLDSITITNASSNRLWATGTIQVSPLQWRRANGTPRPLYFNVSARRNTTIAKIHQYHIRSKVNTAGNLPDREWVWERYPFDDTLETCGTTGFQGPNQTQIDAAYPPNSPFHQKVFSLGNGIQTWQVPFAGIWEIEAAGAGFDGVSNQRGAVAIGQFFFNRNDTIYTAVGQVGANIRCGSGGSFVAIYDTLLTSTDNFAAALGNTKIIPLVCAGGAGGTLTANNVAIGGLAGESGGNASTGALGGVGGLGGAGLGFAVGGAGFRGNGGGSDGVAPNNVTRSFENGAEGNLVTAITPNEPGSFGGGGTGRTTTNYRFGGGGGYSGGAGAQTASSLGFAGGGGSFVNTTLGSTISITAATNIGDGYVTIRFVHQ